MELTREKIIWIMYAQLDMPLRKISYIICHVELIKGLWGMLKAYGVPYTQENHEILIDMVQDILTGTDLEKEWTEEEYNNFVCYKE